MRTFWIRPNWAYQALAFMEENVLSGLHLKNCNFVSVFVHFTHFAVILPYHKNYIILQLKTKTKAMLWLGLGWEFLWDVDRMNEMNVMRPCHRGCRRACQES